MICGAESIDLLPTQEPRSRPARIPTGELDAAILMSFEHSHRLIVDARAATGTALQPSPRRAHLRLVT